MSFLGKKAEWKRSLAHLLIWGMVITGMPGVPVQVQAETQTEVQPEQQTEVQLEEPGEAAYAVSTVSEEVPIVGIDAEVERTVLYSEIDGANGDKILGEITFTMSDGSTVVCHMWDSVWWEYEQYLNYGLCTTSWSEPELDNAGNYPAGDYIYQIYVPETSVFFDTRIKMESLAEIATELTVDGTVSGLAATDNYDDWDYVGGHWLKMELEPGRYEIAKGTDGYVRVTNGSWRSDAWSTDGCAETFGFTVSEARTYYVYVKGAEDFDVVLTKARSVSAISATVKDNKTEHELTGPFLGSVLDDVQITLDDGTVLSCEPYDDVWNMYGIYESLYDADGNAVWSDEDMRFSVGEYTCRIYIPDSDVYFEFPIEVVTVESMAQEIAVGETIYGLSGAVDFYNGLYYEDGHWLKVDLQPGDYTIETDFFSCLELRNAVDFEGLQWGDQYMSFSITEAGTYLVYVKGETDFSVTLTRDAESVEVIGISADLKVSTFYYGIEEVLENKIIKDIKLTLSDGTELSCEMYDDVWNQYNCFCAVYDSEGNPPQSIDYCKYPIGDYIIRIYIGGTEIGCELPIEIVSVDNMTTTLSDGETIYGLSGIDNFNNPIHDGGGHWLKMELAAGSYEISKSSAGFVEIAHADGENIYNDVWVKEAVFRVEEAGEYVAYVKGGEEFSVTLTKVPTIIGLNPLVRCDTFYYEVISEGYPDAEWIVEKLELLLDDGTTQTCTSWDEVWNKYYMSREVYDADGNPAMRYDGTKYPVGEYTFTIYINNTDISCSIPFTIASLSEVEQELNVDETVYGISGKDEWSSDSYTNGLWVKMELEADKYEIAKSSNGSVAVVDALGNVVCQTSAEVVSFSIAEAGVYYAYIKGQADFSATLKKVPSPVKLNITPDQDTFYYEVNSLEFYKVVSKASIELSDGSVENFRRWDTTWNYYGITYELLDEDGNNVQYDDSGKYPVGEYIYKIYVPDTEAICEIPVKVLSVEEEAQELPVNGSVTDLSGTDAYDNFDYTNGHWLKMELEQTGRYQITTDKPGAMRVIMPNGSMSGVCTVSEAVSTWISITTPGTGYLYVKGSEEFDVTLIRFPDITEIEVKVRRTVFYQEACETPNPKLFMELTLEDGTVKTCTPMDLTWGQYGFYDSLTYPNGNAVNWQYQYAIGDYVYKIFDYQGNVVYEVPTQVVSIKDVTTVLPEDWVSLEDAMRVGCYQFSVEDGMYELRIEEGEEVACYIQILNEDGEWIDSRYPFYGTDAKTVGLGWLEQGTYYITFSDDYGDRRFKLSPISEITTMTYSGEDVVFQYGEWGYKVVDTISANVSKRPISSNSVVKGEYITYMPLTFTATTEGGDTVEIGYRAIGWNHYGCNMELLKTDGICRVYTDKNGYIPVGKYIIRISAYGGAILDIPLQVVNGPVELESLSYTGNVQRFEYGTWGYSVKKVPSGNRIDDPRKDPSLSGNMVLSGNNSALGGGGTLSGNSTLSGNTILSGNNTGVLSGNTVRRENVVLYIDFTLHGKATDASNVEIAYQSALWNWYGMQTYLYDAEGKKAVVNRDGYLEVGHYVLKCITGDGLECEVPIEVYAGAGKIAQDQLENAVDEIIKEADVLDDESLSEATEEEKKNVVTEFLDEIARIYEEQDIAQVGAAAAAKAAEIVSALADVEKKIEELLNTVVTVKTQDTETEELEFGIKNALLSVPAGQNAEVRVKNAEVPEHSQIKEGQATAVKVELVTEQEEKKQLQAPVMITMKLPDNIREDEEIAVYHYHGESGSLMEKISVLLGGNRMISFTTGSFSTFVIANVDNSGVTVSGMVTSYGDAADATTVALVDANGNVVAETTADAETGSYQMTNVAVGDYTLAVSKENHVTREYALSVTEDTVQDVKICLIGDVSGDGKLNALDQKKLYNHIAKKTPLTEYDFAVGDVNEDGKINALDQKIVYNHIAKKKMLW